MFRRVAAVRMDVLAIGVTVAAAAATRFSWLDLMEFKADESEASRLGLHVLGYTEPGAGHFFPTEGLISSLGIPNPPLFVYLVAIPLAVVRSPLAVAGFIAATNVLAVWLCYLIGKRCYSRFVGVAAAALFALSPWGIVFSRKIWAQDLLPVFTTLFILQLHAFLVEKRPRAVCWLIVLAAAATQLHFSAWILPVILLGALVLGRKAIEWPWVAFGVGGALALYAPFLAWHTGDFFRAAQHRSAYDGPGAVGRLVSTTHLMFAITGGDKLKFVIGSQTALAAPLSYLLGIAAVAGLVVACKHWRTTPVGRVRLLLAAWYLLPLLALAALPVSIYIHYLIVLFPLPFLGIAYVIERISQRTSAVGLLALATCLGCFGAIDVHFFRTIVDNGGAHGDYGIGYRYKREAVDLFLRQNPGRPFEIGYDLDFAPGPIIQEYQFLTWNSDPDAPAPVGAAAIGYVVVNRFNGTPPLLAADPNAGSYPTTGFGPLEVVSVPLPR